jgi:aminoglycoside phosphotransferase
MSIPKELMDIIKDAVWEKDTMGCSDSSIYKLKGIPGRGTAYLKAQRRTGIDDLRREKDIINWLQGRLPVPEVLYFGELNATDYLLMTEIPGLNCADSSLRIAPEEMAGILAKGLRMIHDVDVSECPFNRNLDITLNEALQRVEAGLVDENDLEPGNMGRKACDIYDELIRTRPLDEDLVFTHGDYCLPNIVVSNDNLSGFIDWGRAGVADRYQDLALAARSLRHNMRSQSSELTSLFFHEYGIGNIDSQKMHYYVLLDELF